jgi:hypothetical protein
VKSLPPDAHDLRIPFSLRGLGGLITVSLTRNTDPEAIGYALLSGGQPTDFARDFPVCRGTVTYPAQGYAAVFGWTQMIRSTDTASDGFEMDPIALYQQVPTPYAFFGIRPELFDAPSRCPSYQPHRPGIPHPPSVTYATHVCCHLTLGAAANDIDGPSLLLERHRWAIDAV